MQYASWRLWALVALSFASGVAPAQTIRGAGSSAAAEIYRAWAAEYGKTRQGLDFGYDAVGSSNGIKRIRARETDFGASDVAPPQEELKAAGLLVFPIAITGIVPVVNLPKVPQGEVKLTGELLARIFLGEIRRWDAAEIAQVNPGLALPKLPITVVVRGDGSGSTYNFADYLSKVSPAWRERMGVKTSLTWPQGMVAVKGSRAVAEAVLKTPGAIAYIDFDYVDDHNLSAVQLPDAKQNYVKPSAAGFRIALAGSEWTSKGNFTAALTGLNAPGAWPITMGTFVLVPQVADDATRMQETLRFFTWAFSRGDAVVQKHNFVRLPDRVQALAFKVIASVKDKSGRAIGLML